MSKFIDALKGKAHPVPPVWMMRQAGRYLPEYRKVRAQAGSFLDLCYNPQLAAEVTLQPIRRFGFDAAILFSDILVIPHALGRDLRFEEGSGPVMTPIEASEIEQLDGENLHARLAPVYETVERVRAELAPETPLIGFCGAPWTVATYMIAGRGTPDQAPARSFSYANPEAFQLLVDRLVDSSSQYLIRQVEAGAQALQIFDSWCGVLDEEGFERWCIRPIAEMIRRIGEACPDIPVIAFPKGAGARYAGFRARTNAAALGLDWAVGLDQAASLQTEGAVQGNLDPLRLLAGGPALERGIESILDALAEGPFIFNLGHGILPQTPISHVEEMLALIRGGKA